MADLTSQIRIGQAFSLASAGIVTGISFGLSYLSIPSVLLAPPHAMLRQWGLLFNLGKALVPTSTIVSASSFLYLAYVFPSKARLYAASGAFMLSIMPHTLVWLMPTNKKLLARIESMNKLTLDEDYTEKDVPAGEKTEELVAKWGRLNYYRALLLFTGTTLGAWATFA